jgi:streptogramin lyase
VLAGLLAAGAALGAFLLARGEPNANAPTVALAGGALQRVDPATNRLVATYRLGGEPVDVAAGAGAVWAVDGGRNALVRVDPETDEVVTRGLGTGKLAAVTTWGTSWVGVGADGPNGAVLTWLDSKTLALREGGIGPGPRPSRSGKRTPAGVPSVGDVAGTTVSGWVLDLAAGTLTQVSMLPELSDLDLSGTPTAMTRLPGDEVLVSLTDPGTRLFGSVVRVDEIAGIVERRRAGFTPTALATGDSGVWAVDADLQRVFSIDLDPVRGMSRGGLLRVSGRPLDVAVGGGAVWVVTSLGKLLRIDPETSKVVAAIDIGANPVAVDVDEHGVWVAVAGGAPLSIDDLPRRWSGAPYRPESVRPGGPRDLCSDGTQRRACTEIVGGRLVGEDGSAATASFGWHERRRQGGVVDCQGRIYTGPVTSEVVGDAGTGRLDMQRWGTIALRLDRAAFAWKGPSAGATLLCGQQSGTWVGVRGPVKGLRGTFTTPRPYNTVLLAGRRPLASAPHQLQR